MEELKLLDEIAVAAREAGAAILEIVRRGFEVESKRDSSPVTEADLVLGATTPIEMMYFSASSTDMSSSRTLVFGTMTK